MKTTKKELEAALDMACCQIVKNTDVVRGLDPRSHCVVYSATTIPKVIRGPLMWMLAQYNDKFNAPVKSDKN